MPEGALPVAEVGTREGETSARHGRGSDFQGIRVLHHRLSEPVVQGGGQKRVCPESSRRRRKILWIKGDHENSFTCSDRGTGKEVAKRIRIRLTHGDEQPDMIRRRHACHYIL